MTAVAPLPVEYRQVDVFADAPYRGNGLVVAFCPSLDVAAERLRLVAEEMRQFETIFLGPVAAGDRSVEARIDDAYYEATMDQGIPVPSEPLYERREELARALDLPLEDLAPLPLQVISTGVPYLIVPVLAAGLGKARAGPVRALTRPRRGARESATLVGY